MQEVKMGTRTSVLQGINVRRVVQPRFLVSITLTRTNQVSDSTVIADIVSVRQWYSSYEPLIYIVKLILRLERFDVHHC